MKGIEIIKTQDGSDTIYVPHLDEHYHSTHGAMQESMHVFIYAGLNYLVDRGEKQINILEVGFGTGMNCMNSLNYVEEKQDVNVYYEGIEPYPLATEVMEKLTFYSDEIRGKFIALHQADWNKRCQLASNFVVKKVSCSLQKYQAEKGFNLIYFDAFGFRAQEEMWDESVFEKLYGLLQDNGVLVTYASKGIVRRRMQNVGFLVEKLPGPKGKREMVRAVKKNKSLAVSGRI